MNTAVRPAEDQEIIAAMRCDGLGPVIDSAGAAAAWHIYCDHRGETLHIPQTTGDDHWLPRKIGTEAAGRLCQELGPSSFPVPVGRTIRKVMRDRYILEQRAEGLSVNAIANRLGVSQRTVRYVIAANRVTA